MGISGPEWLYETEGVTELWGSLRRAGEVPRLSESMTKN